MSPYYSKLRERIGNSLLLMPGVAAIIRNPEGELLLQKKSDGTWSLPAGAIEPGETPEEALEREVKEETGYTVRDLQLVGTFGGLEFRYIYPNGHEVENIVLLYLCSCDDMVALPTDEETQLLQYFPEQSFPGLELPYPKQILYGIKMGEQSVTPKSDRAGE